MTRDNNDYYRHDSLREDEKRRLEDAETALFHMQMETADLRKQIAQLEAALEAERLRNSWLINR